MHRSHYEALMLDLEMIKVELRTSKSYAELMAALERVNGELDDIQDTIRMHSRIGHKGVPT
jgi:hypothetical protein